MLPSAGPRRHKRPGIEGDGGQRGRSEPASSRRDVHCHGCRIWWLGRHSVASRQTSTCDGRGRGRGRPSLGWWVMTPQCCLAAASATPLHSTTTPPLDCQRVYPSAGHPSQQHHFHASTLPFHTTAPCPPHLPSITMWNGWSPSRSLPEPPRSLTCPSQKPTRPGQQEQGARLANKRCSYRT